MKDYDSEAQPYRIREAFARPGRGLCRGRPERDPAASHLGPGRDLAAFCTKYFSLRGPPLRPRFANLLQQHAEQSNVRDVQTQISKTICQAGRDGVATQSLRPRGASW